MREKENSLKPQQPPSNPVTRSLTFNTLLTHNAVRTGARVANGRLHLLAGQHVPCVHVEEANSYAVVTLQCKETPPALETCLLEEHRHLAFVISLPLQKKAH